MTDFDAVIVGGGFAGVCMLHRVRGPGLTARVYEAGSGVGGTWFWNRYPGARCDVESMEYSYQSRRSRRTCSERRTRRTSSTASCSPPASTR